MCALAKTFVKEDKKLFPTGSLASSDIALLTYYVAVLGALLMVGVILRTKLRFLKKIYMPASLIAGAIGVILGQNCLGLLPADMTSTFAALPGSLIVVVFAPMLMCADFGDIHGLKGAKKPGYPAADCVFDRQLYSNCHPLPADRSAAGPGFSMSTNCFPPLWR